MRYYRTILKQLKQATALASAASLLVVQTAAYADPLNGQVAAGSADIMYARGHTDITQSSQRAVIDWNSFNIGTGETVQFNQPSASAIALNRIHDSNPSSINGALNANGQVWLVNPSGMVFGSNAQVNVGGLLATTSGIDNDRFMNGDYRFSHPGNSLASIVNYGSIRVANGGLAALVGPNVTNSGLIDARLGKVQLGSGDIFALDLYGDGLINLQASPGITSQLVSNSGTITADGGKVLLTAAAAQNEINSLINVGGLIQANSIDDRNGEIRLYAEGSNAVSSNTAAEKGIRSGNSTVLVSGTLEAKGNHSGEKGGLIEALGDWLGITSGATLDASGNAGGGTIRVGGDYHGEGATPTASRTVVQGSTNLLANATDHGDGGHVIVWADDRTDFEGHIEANGGANGGNGGFVETSGKETLNATGSVMASALLGEAGTWLLDPNNVTISTSANSNSTGSPDFTLTGTPAVINVSSLLTPLNSGTNVSVTASGSITLATNITENTYNGTGGLKLQAGTDIVFNSNVGITASGNSKLNVTLDADRALGGGAIVMNSGSSITTNGGFITMGGQGDPATLAAVGTATNTAGINLNNATLDAGGGNIKLNGTGYAGTANAAGIKLQSNAKISTINSGTITLNGTGGNGTSGNVGISLSGTNTQYISSQDGEIKLNGIGAGSTTGNYGISVTGGATNPLIKTTTGKITLTGTRAGTTNQGINMSATTQTDVIQSGGNVTLKSDRDISLTKSNINYVGSQAINVLLDSDMNDSGNGAIFLSNSNITSNGGYIVLGGGSNPGKLVNAALASTAAYGSATNLYGVNVTNSQLKALTGNIWLEGVGNNSAGSGRGGVQLSNSLLQTSGSGIVTVTGTGSGTTSNGVSMSNNSLIESLSANDLTITGKAAGSADAIVISNSSLNDAIHVNGGTVKLLGDTDINIGRARINSPNNSAFNLILNADTDNNTTGSVIASFSEFNTNGGNITMGGGTDPTTGVATAWRYSNGVQISSSNINAGGGNIIANGVGRISTGTNQAGVYLDGTALVQTSGNGGITMYGVGGKGFDYNYGIAVRSSGVNTGIRAENGDINLTAVFSPGSTETYSQPFMQTGGNVIGTTGSGDLVITSTGSPYVVADIYIDNTTTNQWGTSTMTGDIRVNANSVQFNSLNILTLGDVYFTPRTDGTSIGVFGGAGTLNIGPVPNSTGIGPSITAAHTYIGNSHSGTISINDHNWVGDLIVRSGSDIGFSGITGMGGKNLSAETAGGNITLGTVQNAASITAKASGNMTLNGTLTATGNGTAITLSDGGTFTNTAGASALTASNGRWLVYSANPANDALGGLTASFHRYSCVLGGSCPALGSGNGLLYSISPTVTVTANNVTGTYGSIAAFSANYSGFINGDNAASALTGAASFSTNATLSSSGNYNAGIWNINTAAGTLASALGYQLQFTGGLLNVTPKTVSVSGLSAADKLYDGTTAVSISGTPVLSGKIGGDHVNFNMGGAAFADANAGAGKLISFAGSLSGVDAANYIVGTNNLTASITPLSINVTAHNENRTYGSPLYPLGYSYSGAAGIPVFSGMLGSTASASSNAGTYDVTLGTLSAGSNYAINFTPATLFIIPNIDNAVNQTPPAPQLKGISGSQSGIDHDRKHLLYYVVSPGIDLHKQDDAITH